MIAELGCGPPYCWAANTLMWNLHVGSDSGLALYQPQETA